MLLVLGEDHGFFVSPTALVLMYDIVPNVVFINGPTPSYGVNCTLHVYITAP